MTKPVLSRSIGSSAISLAPSSPQELLKLGRELYRINARRAYQVYERHGRRQGLDVGDWVQAEAEIVLPCRHALAEPRDRSIFAQNCQADSPGMRSR